MTVQLGLRLRVVLSHAIYTKLLRMKVGVDASSDDDPQARKGDPAGRMNSKQNILGFQSNMIYVIFTSLIIIIDLVGTDVDAITAALPSFIQLLAVPFKLVVSLTYLYVLLGWR